VTTDPTFTIADLSRLTGLNVRTIRYYLAQGLLPASREPGPGAHYGQGHLDRLRLTKRLQQQHLPLAEIRTRLAAMTDEEVASVAVGPVDPVAPSTSALDYVRGVLGSSGSSDAPRVSAFALPAMAAPAVAPTAASLERPLPAAAPPARTSAARTLVSEARGMPTTRIPDGDAATGLESAVPTGLESAAPPVAGMPTTRIPDGDAATGLVPAAPTHRPTRASQPEPPTLERSQWERLSLGPNLELHIRRPLGRLEQRRVERLITIARQVLKEGQS
jgi:DNA-binding transcriptional MerR regulator